MQIGLDNAAERSVQNLIQALIPQQTGEDTFVYPATVFPKTTTTTNRKNTLDYAYGGQLLAQALIAAGKTVEQKEPQSLHATFVTAGRESLPMEVTVERIRDGRSIAIRQVALRQDGKPVLIAIASFHRNATATEVAAAAPEITPPEQTPLFSDWLSKAGSAFQSWVNRTPALEFRLPEAPRFLGGEGTNASRSHWMRLRAEMGDDRLLHAGLLAYASDYFLMDMVFRAHPAEDFTGLTGLSLDHAIWFHRPSNFDAWHLYTQEAVTISGERGLARGAIYDRDGHHVATTTQEVLIRQENNK